MMIVIERAIMILFCLLHHANNKITNPDVSPSGFAIDIT